MLEEVYKKLKTVGIPVAYLKFDTPQELPFCVYYESNTDIRGADNLNMIRQTSITIELYSEEKIPELERKIEALFNDREIIKSEDIYIKDENMIEIVFEIETIDKF